MCNPIIIGAALGATSSFLNAEAQNEAADAMNRGLEVQMKQQRVAERDLNNQLRNSQQAINENGVAARFQRDRQSLLDLGQITAQNAQAGISGAGRQGAVQDVKHSLDLAILNANQGSRQESVQQQIRSNELNTQAQIEGIQSQQQFGVSGLQSGVQILSGAFGGAITGQNVSNALQSRRLG